MCSPTDHMELSLHKVAYIIKIFIQELSLGFEYNGEQHYLNIPMYHSVLW